MRTLARSCLVLLVGALGACNERSYRFPDAGAMAGTLSPTLVPADAVDIEIAVWDDSTETWGRCSYTHLDLSGRQLQGVPVEDVPSLDIPVGPKKWFDRRLGAADGLKDLADSGWQFYVSGEHRYVLAVDPIRKRCWFYSGSKVMSDALR